MRPMMARWARQVPDFEDNVNDVRQPHDIVEGSIDRNRWSPADLNYEREFGLACTDPHTRERTIASVIDARTSLTSWALPKNSKLAAFRQRSMACRYNSLSAVNVTPFISSCVRSSSWVLSCLHMIKQCLYLLFKSLTACLKQNPTSSLENSRFDAYRTPTVGCNLPDLSVSLESTAMTARERDGVHTERDTWLSSRSALLWRRVLIVRHVCTDHRHDWVDPFSVEMRSYCSWCLNWWILSEDLFEN